MNEHLNNQGNYCFVSGFHIPSTDAVSYNTKSIQFINQNGKKPSIVNEVKIDIYICVQFVS